MGKFILLFEIIIFMFSIKEIGNYVIVIRIKIFHESNETQIKIKLSKKSAIIISFGNQGINIKFSV